MKKYIIIFILLISAGVLSYLIYTVINFQKTGSITVPNDISPIQTSFSISSPAFNNYGKIPVKYTCDGENISPPLSISGIPENTKTLALIIDDKDTPSGTWVHWLVWNIPADTDTISEGSNPIGSSVGYTDFGDTRYGGPCPTTGEHRYFFTLYALDNFLVFPENTDKTRFIDAINGHVISKAELVGLYER